MASSSGPTTCRKARRGRDRSVAAATHHGDRWHLGLSGNLRLRRMVRASSVRSTILQARMQDTLASVQDTPAQIHEGLLQQAFQEIAKSTKARLKWHDQAMESTFVVTAEAIGSATRTPQAAATGAEWLRAPWSKRRSRSAPSVFALKPHAPWVLHPLPKLPSRRSHTNTSCTRRLASVRLITNASAASSRITFSRSSSASSARSAEPRYSGISLRAWRIVQMEPSPRN